MTTPTQAAQLLYSQLKPGAKHAFVSYITDRTPHDLQAVMKTIVEADVANFFDAPVVVDAPFVSQTGTGAGSTLNCTQGNWTDDPDTKTFQWKKGGVNVAGATAASYVVQAADVGTSFTCSVIATNVAGSSAPSLSNAVVVAATPP